MLICKDCRMPWEDVGSQWERPSRKGSFDYSCKCGSKKKPVNKSDDDETLEELEGKLEYTPKHELLDNGYKVHYRDTYVVATHEEIRKALMMYCVGGLTINQVAMAMLWTREEFNAIKTAFHITKDAPPFTEYEIDQLTADQMAELVRVEKKRHALTKLNASVDQDIKKEIDRYNKADYFINKICERVNKFECNQWPRLPGVRSDVSTVIIKITDEHAGLTVNNIDNTYDLEVMRKRFLHTTAWVMNNIKENHINLESGGDLVHGLIHGSTEKYSTFVLDALEVVMDCYKTMIATWLQAGYSVSFAKANGSHSALERNKQSRTEEENLGRLLPFYLDRVFEDAKGFTLLKPLAGKNHTLIPVGLGLKRVMTGHGDEMQMAKFASSANDISRKLGVKITEVHLGHIHHYKAEYIDGVLVEYTPSFCGTDQYASKLGLSGQYGFGVFKYDVDGKRKNYEFIEFND